MRERELCEKHSARGPASGPARVGGRVRGPLDYEAERRRATRLRTVDIALTVALYALLGMCGIALLGSWLFG